MKFAWVIGSLLAVVPASGLAAAVPIKVVAAESVYAEPLERIGGASVAVTSIVAATAPDPHDYEPTPSAARAFADADLVVYNGNGYDPWAERLLAASGAASRVAINVAWRMSRIIGDNPHVWYDPRTMAALTDEVVRTLSELQPATAAAYVERGNAYKEELAAITDRVARLRQVYGGTPVAATEPVFGPMTDALGLVMRHRSFQQAVMIEAPPSARDISALESDIKARAIHVLFYNVQVSDALTARLVTLAKASGVPVVGVSETKPPELTYVQWILAALDATESALAKSETAQ